MTVEGQTTGTVMEIGMKEVGIGMKKQKEEHWTIFGEEGREQLAMLDDGINMTKRITEEEVVGVDVDMAMMVDMEEEEAADMVVGVEVIMETREDTEETMRDMVKTTEVMVKTTEVMVETTEGMVEMTEGSVEVAMMEDTEETEAMEEMVADMEETMGAMEETMVAMEETVEAMKETVGLAMVVVDLVDKVDMGEARVAPETEEWEVQWVVAGQGRGRGVRKQWVQWLQRGRGQRWGLLETIPGMLDLGPNRCLNNFFRVGK